MSEYNPEKLKIHGEDYVLLPCPGCGIFKIVPAIVHETHRRDGGFSYCCNGHQYGYLTGEERKGLEAIRLERDRLKQDAARLEEEIAAERRRADAAEKRVLQVRRRAAAGVCPCCNRSFVALARHMKTKHPEFRNQVIHVVA